MALKDKPVGGTNTEPTKYMDHWDWHTSLLLTFSSYRNQNFYAFAPIVNTRNPVNWVPINCA